MSGDPDFDESGVLAAALDLIPFGVYVADVANHGLVYANRAMRRRIGEPAARKCWEAVYGQEGPCLHCRIPALLSPDGRPTGATEVFDLFNEADEHWYQMHERCLAWPDGRIVKYAIAVDISGLKRDQNSLAEAHAELALRSREVERQSATDHLTGIANRRQLDRVLAAECGRAARAGRPLALLMCDLDRFKLLNDTHGHAAGDRVLAQAAALMRQGLRRGDTLGRWGGEEFLAILPDADPAGALATGEKLRAVIAGHDFGPGMRCTASIGAACWQPGDTPETLLARADQALYRAKQAGRDRVCG